MAISAGRPVPDDDLLRWADLMVEIGVEAVQLRERHLGDRRLLDLARALRRRIPAPTRLLISARFDIALAAAADGAHLPADHLPALRVRAAAPDLLLGLSTHTLEEVSAASPTAVDYVLHAPVFAPISKPAARPPLGLAGLAEAVAASPVPLLALGGIDEKVLEGIAATGAHGVAGIGVFQQPGSASFVARAHALFPPRSTGA